MRFDICKNFVLMKKCELFNIVIKSLIRGGVKLLSALIALIFINNYSYGQLVTYSGDGSGGGTTMTVTANASVTALQYTGFGSTTGCTSGGISGLDLGSSYASYTSYSSSNPNLFFKVTPNAGYSVTATSFNAIIRCSKTGPTKVVFAYSIDSGYTWTTSGNMTVNTSYSCGALTGSYTWSGMTSVTNTSSSKGVFFAIFPFSANSSTGVIQINGISIGGSVNCMTPNVYSVTTTSGSTCTGATFNVTASDVWASYALKNGSTVEQTIAGTGSSISFSSASSSTTGNYAVVATNTVTACSSSTATMTNTISITSCSTAAAISTQPTNKSLCASTGTTTFSVVATGTPAPSYQWQRSTTGTTGTFSNITGSSMDAGITYGSYTSAALTISSASSSVNGYAYRCYVSNTGGNATSNAVTLTVNSVSVSPSSNTPVTVGNAIDLYTGTVSGGTSPYTYTWTGPASFSSTAQNPVITSAGSTSLSGTYSVTVTDANSCSGIGSTSVTVNAPTNSITTTSTTFSPLCNSSANTLSVTYTTTGTFVGSFTAQLSNSSGSFISPTTIGTGSSSPISCTINASTASGTGYRIRVINSSPATNGTDNGNNISIYDPSVGGSVSSDQSFCAGTTPSALTLSGNTGSVTGWQYATSSSFSSPATIPSSSGVTTLTATAIGTPTVTTYYRATIQNGACVSANSSYATISVNPTPVMGAISGVAAVCSGVPLTLSDTTVTGGTYSWSSSNTSVATVSTSGIVTGLGDGSATITYAFVFPTTSCSNNVTATLTFNQTPSAITLTPANVSLCSGSNAQTVNATGGTISGTVNATSSSISGSPGVASALVTSTVNVTGIPAGATITGVAVTINYASTYMSNYILNLEAPNGNILNLMYLDGNTSNSSVQTLSGIVISSSGSSGLSGIGSTSTVTGTYAADEASGAGASPYTSNVGSWSSLNSTPNGVWTFSINNSYSGSHTSTFTSWAIAVSYSMSTTYSWSPSGSSSGLYTNTGATTAYSVGATYSPIYVKPSSNGTYTYTLTSTHGNCSVSSVETATKQTSLTVASITTGATGGVNICMGTPDTLLDATGGGSFSTSSSAISLTSLGTIGGSQATAVTGVTAGSGATVTYTVSQTGCTSALATYTVSVNALPTVSSISGTPTTLCTGSPATLSDATSSGSYSWSTSNTSIATINSSGVLTGLAAGSALITYTFNNGICSNIATTNVTVGYSPTTFSLTPTSTTICSNGSAILLTAGGSTIPTTASQSFNTTSSTNGLGSSNGSLTSTVTVSGIPASATITVGSVTMYFGISKYMSDLVFNLVAPNGTVINLLNREGTSSSSSQTFNPVIVSSAATTAASGIGSSSSVSGTYAADGITGVGSSTYTSNVNTLSALTTIPNGTWTLVIYDAFGSAHTASLSSWTLNLGYTYNASAPISWTPTSSLYTNSGASTGYSSGTASTTVYALPAAGSVVTYTATATTTLSTCTTTQTANVVVSATPAISASGSTTICSGTVTLNASPTSGTAGTYTYQWYKGASTITGASNTYYTPSVTGTYSVAVTTTAGSCNVTSSGTGVTFNAVPSLTSASNTATSGSACTGAAFNLVANGASNVTGYAWTGPDAISSSTGSTASVGSATTTGTDVYTVTVNNGTGTGLSLIHI